MKLLLQAFMLTLLLSSTFIVDAARLDKMLLVADENGNGVYMFLNDQPQTYFVEATISELGIDSDGQLKKKEYNLENLSQWQIALSNPKIIVEQGRAKSVGVQAICGNKCDFEQDKMFEIAFVPKPFNSHGEASSVSVFIGYAAIFIIPAKKPVYDYSIQYDGEGLFIHNSGNSMVQVIVDQCVGVRESGCNASFLLLRGRKKYFKLPDKLQFDKLNVHVVNHDESYSDRFTVNKSS